MMMMQLVLRLAGEVGSGRDGGGRRNVLTADGQKHGVGGGWHVQGGRRERGRVRQRPVQRRHSGSVQPSTHTHTRLTALFRDYPGEPVPER